MKQRLPSSATQPFTRTDRLRRRRKLELKRSSSSDDVDSNADANDDDENDDDDDENENEHEFDDLEDDNPLIHYMDTITMERIITPAMSPDGHVMGLASWIKCLKEYRRCPITFKTVHPEELIILTKTNFSRHNRIFNITKRLRKFEE